MAGDKKLKKSEEKNSFGTAAYVSSNVVIAGVPSHLVTGANSRITAPRQQQQQQQPAAAATFVCQSCHSDVRRRHSLM